MVTRASTNSLKPKAYTATKHPITCDFSDFEPKTFLQAKNNPNWQHAMQLEFDALIANGTWDLVPRPPASNIVGCKWVFRIKKKPDGSIDRYKARLVAKGYSQEEGVDYFDTFSPVIKQTTIRVVLSIAVTRNWPLRQVDINNAFLNGDLAEIVYMEQAPGFISPDRPSHVCRLKKALYGLKQAPRAWFQKLNQALLRHGFRQCISDSSLFIKHHGSDVVYVLVYVDDLIISGSNSSFIDEFVKYLNSVFSLKDLGALNFFLGIEVHRTDSGLLLSQRKYILDLLDRSKMMGAKSIASPAVPGSRLISGGDPFLDVYLYRSIVGALQYATITRPEISYSVNRVCQFMHKPSDHHWAAVKRILRYLKGSLNTGLFFRPARDSRLVCFTDAGWASDPEDCRSQHGFSIYFGGNLVSWSSRKQNVVARSSTEAEYRAIAFASAELIWLQQLLTEMAASSPGPPILFCDNLSATFLTANPVFHQRSKHIKIDYHFVREQVQAGDLIVRHVNSADQIADIFTKAVGTSRFQNLRSKLLVRARS